MREEELPQNDGADAEESGFSNEDETYYVCAKV